MATHRVSVTVSDPDHTMTHMRTAKVEKRIRVKADSPQDATARARDYYKKRGFKVHDHNHIGEITEQAEQIDEVGDTNKGQKLLRQVNKRAVDRLVSKRADTDPAYAKKAQQTHLAADSRLKEAKDPREYDYEGDMAKSQLRAIIANAQQVHDMLKDDTNMAEWVQSKITLAADYISTVADYMQSEVKEETDVYAKAEENKRSADAAKKQGDMFAHHLHMADHHDNLAQWNAEKGRHAVADTHAAKSEKHHDQAMKLKEEVELDEAAGHTIEAHGIRGMKGTPWRKTFKSHDHLSDWAEKNDSVEIHGTRDLEGAKKKTNEAWNQGNRNPQRGIKVGDKVRSYDFPGMHDDHYVEGHVVADNAHTYHIRVNKVVRSGKEIPTPAHMAHVEAPKGKGMFSSAYAVHKIMAKQASVAATAEPTQGAARTFTSLRGRK